ncbi:hypothetical protein YC2023_051469 [Brassica napus]
MVNILGTALPRFLTNEVNILKNSRVYFTGINHYTSYFIRDCLVSPCNTGSGAFKAEGFALKLDRIGNVTIGFGDLQKPETTIKELLHVAKRTQYMSGYLEALSFTSSNEGWSKCEGLFEWASGYKVRLGYFMWIKQLLKGHRNSQLLGTKGSQMNT